MLETEKNFNLKAVLDLDWLNAILVWNLLISEMSNFASWEIIFLMQVQCHHTMRHSSVRSGLHTWLTFTFWWQACVFHCSIHVFWNEIDVTKPLTFFQFFLLFLNYCEVMSNCLIFPIHQFLKYVTIIKLFFSIKANLNYYTTN